MNASLFPYQTCSRYSDKSDVILSLLLLSLLFMSLKVKGDCVVSRTAVSTNEAFCFRYFSGRAIGDPGFSRNELYDGRSVHPREFLQSHYALRRIATRRREMHKVNSAGTGCVGSGFGGCNYRARLGCISLHHFLFRHFGEAGSPFPEF